MSVHGVQGQCNYHRNEGCCDQSKQSCNCNGKFWSVVFIPHAPSEDSRCSKGCGFCESGVQKKVSAAPKTVAGKYIFKLMMTIFKWYFPPVNHCRARERRLHCSGTVLLQAFKPLRKLKVNFNYIMALHGSGRIVQCHFRIPRGLVEQDCKTLDVSVSPIKR